MACDHSPLASSVTFYVLPAVEAAARHRARRGPMTGAVSPGARYGAKSAELSWSRNFFHGVRPAIGSFILESTFRTTPTCSREAQGSPIRISYRKEDREHDPKSRGPGQARRRCFTDGYSHEAARRISDGCALQLCGFIEHKKGTFFGWTNWTLAHYRLSVLSLRSNMCP